MSVQVRLKRKYRQDLPDNMAGGPYAARTGNTHAPKPPPNQPCAAAPGGASAKQLRTEHQHVPVTLVVDGRTGRKRWVR